MNKLLLITLATSHSVISCEKSQEIYEAVRQYLNLYWFSLFFGLLMAFFFYAQPKLYIFWGEKQLK